MGLENGVWGEVMPVPKGEDGLTTKQAAFIREYLIDLNATQAAIRAGYSAKTAGRVAGQVMQKPAVQQALRKAMNERSEKTEITAEYVLKTIKDTIEKNKSGETYDARSVLKGCELLGRHLGLFNDKLTVGVSVGDVMAAFPEPIQKQIREALAKKIG